LKISVHIAGIGGTFMAGLALIAREAGFEVSGCDQAVYPPMSDLLHSQGIAIQEGYHPEQLDTAPELFVIGNALSRGNPLIEHILQRRRPYTSGPQWLRDAIIPQKRVLAVAGTHGKTTTASIAAFVLEQCRIEPGFLIGGVPGNFDVSARLGEGDWFVIEADEYDTAFFDKRAKFLHYRPDILILGNLEFDHADIFDSIGDIERQFEYLLRSVPSDGVILVNADHPELNELLARGCWSRIVPYSCTDVPATWRAVALQADCRRFEVFHEDVRVAVVDWPLMGRHNMANALGAIAASQIIGAEPAAACASLAEFQAPRRRLERTNPSSSIALFDDFAHHPTAVRETLRSLQSLECGGKLIAILEPRSNTMKRGVHRVELAQALSIADTAIIRRRDDLDWDPAELTPLADGAKITVCDSIPEIVDTVCGMAEPGDRIVMMSNGSFDGLRDLLSTRLD